MAKNRSGAGLGKLLLGIMLGVLAACGAMFAYRHYGNLRRMPSSTVQTPHRLPHPQRAIAKAVEHTKVMIPPFGASEDAFEGGARVYREECAKCHGLPGHEVAFGKAMNPAARQLWKSNKERSGGTGVHSVSDLYGKVANGIRLTAMPAYKHVLSETQMWQVSLLLANADKELPDPVRQVLMGR